MSTKLSYSDQLKSPLWQRKRLEILERDEFTCQQCSSVENTLHIHHKSYISGQMLWEYHDGLLITLCKDCHQTEENWKGIYKSYINSFFCNGGDYMLLAAILGSFIDYGGYFDMDERTMAIVKLMKSAKHIDELLKDDTIKVGINT